ncbi:MAG: membrane protein insertase YidC [Gemmatimonadaceae bacterium]|jgi:YidC/Oxa1 family membrane protein insertase|nr:membrane protein insertase YidC [Gemmatimonadaceae bacterium]
MDIRRVVLAVVLMAAVLFVTPILFPTARSKAPVGKGADSTALAAPVTPPAAVAPGAAAAPVTPAVIAGAAQPGDSAVLPTVPVETTTVQTALATFRVSNVGAQLVSARMTQYRALDGTKGSDGQAAPVELARPTAPLVSMRAVVPGDTLLLDAATYTLERSQDGGREVLAYSATVKGTPVSITYTFAPDSYLVRVDTKVQHASNQGFVLYRLPAGLRTTEADTTADHQALAYAFKPEKGGADIRRFDALEPDERNVDAGPLTWAIAKNKYFILGLLIPTGGKPFAELITQGVAKREGEKFRTTATGTLVAPLDNGVHRVEVYAGPQEWKRLHALGRSFEESNPYGGWLQGFVQPFATLVIRGILWCKENLKLSYGWVLVLIGVIVRLLMWPLNQKMLRTSLVMQRISPELQEIQKKYGNDPTKMQAEMMRVYKQHNVSPFSTVSGCLPMLLPMPVFFALFFVFQNTIEFRGVPFLWLPDISVKDPFYILPLVVAATQMLTSFISLKASPPNPQAKMMAYMLPAVFLVFFINVASGLNLYYAVQNVVGIPQQWLLARERGKASKA